MQLEELQPKIFDEINKAIEVDRVSHAYLFSGYFASFDMALYIAKSRFCENKNGKLPCLTCRACRLIEKKEYTDVKIVEPVGQVIKTDTIRELLKEFSHSGYEGKAQFFIIREAHKMHPNAANALLKFIEEPQSESYIVLLTDDFNHILPTIRSRTQIIRFPKNKEFLIKRSLQSDLLKSQALILAELAQTPLELEHFLSQKRILDIIDRCERFLKKIYDTSPTLYLEVAKLSSFILDKEEQTLCFSLLVILCQKDLYHVKTPEILKKLYQAREMCLAHVTFQNSLEYMVLTLAKS